MKTLKEFYSNADAAAGPTAGFDLKLFPGAMDLLSQDFQTPEEANKPIYSNWGGVYPVMHVSLSSNLGDGPSIDSMVQASKEFVNRLSPLGPEGSSLNAMNKHNLKQFLNIKKDVA